jgi:hypothetical protein
MAMLLRPVEDRRNRNQQDIARLSSRRTGADVNGLPTVLSLTISARPERESSTAGSLFRLSPSGLAIAGWRSAPPTGL